MQLINAFATLTDHRRAQGLRVTQEQVLTMVVVAYVCGYFTYRKIETFAKAHSAIFTEVLGLKHPVPSFMTFRDIIVHTDQAELITIFNAWAIDFAGIEPNDWVSGDGKSLRSTVSDAQSAAQDFQSVVSFFAQKTGMVILLETYKNKKISEIEVVTGLLNSLKDRNLHFILDALHIQKKQ
jgi:DDE_Tnp_1-associated